MRNFTPNNYNPAIAIIIKTVVLLQVIHFIIGLIPELYMDIRSYLWIFSSIWLAVVGGGMFGLAAYNAKPSSDTVILVNDSAFVSAGDSCTARILNVLLFLHPRCPCSRAAISELERTLRMPHDSVDIKAIFFKPATAPDSWVRHGTWNLCGEIRGVRRIIDADGYIARRYGVLTSGHILAYSQGKLLFSGGITESRGHEGDNPARRSFGRIIQGDRSGCEQMPIFGCSLFSECRE
ncbi:hypothetical protein MASR2M18_15050 [Ignavibacteria bacterium]